MKNRIKLCLQTTQCTIFSLLNTRENIYIKSILIFWNNHIICILAIYSYHSLISGKIQKETLNGILDKTFDNADVTFCCRGLNLVKYSNAISNFYHQTAILFTRLFILHIVSQKLFLFQGKKSSSYFWHISSTIDTLSAARKSVVIRTIRVTTRWQCVFAKAREFWKTFFLHQIFSRRKNWKAKVKVSYAHFSIQKWT